MKSYTDQAEAELLYNEGNVTARMGMFEDALSLYDQKQPSRRNNKCERQNNK